MTVVPEVIKKEQKILYRMMKKVLRYKKESEGMIYSPDNIMPDWRIDENLS